jgi:hypothetical protein
MQWSFISGESKLDELLHSLILNKMEEWQANIIRAYFFTKDTILGIYLAGAPS